MRFRENTKTSPFRFMRAEGLFAVLSAVVKCEAHFAVIHIGGTREGRLEACETEIPNNVRLHFLGCGETRKTRRQDFQKGSVYRHT